MSEEKKNLPVDEVEVDDKISTKADTKKAAKRPNIFVRIWKRLCKLCKDVVGEMKKVVWTPKNELKKSTKLVLAAVVAISIAIVCVDTACSWLINSLAGLIG